MLRLLAILTLLPAALLLAWLALGKSEPRADFVVSSDELRTIDPQRVSYLDEILVANALFEGLLRPDARMQPEPGVATHWDIDAARTQYTFHLRGDARWSNGRPVTAEDFRFSWLRVLDPQSEAQYASLLFVLDGAEAYYRSRLNADRSDDAQPAGVGVQALDDATLRVRLKAPCPYFLDLAAFPTLAPGYPPLLREFAYRDGVALNATRHLWTRPEHIVCNGPFVLKSWEFKRRLLLERNPRYWDPRCTDADSIEIFTSASPNAALLAYETGRIDLVRGVDWETARGLAREQQAGRRPDFHLGQRFATFFFRVNCQRPPFRDNPDLRKALALAVDRRSLCENVLGLGESPADTYVPRAAIALMPRSTSDGGTIFYQPPEGLGWRQTAGRAVELPYEDRVALARELLARSGFESGSEPRPLELAYASEPPQQRKIAEAVQAMWERALGIRVELRVMERKVLSERIRNLDYDIVRSDWFGDYLDPSTFLDMFTTASGQNRTGWSNAAYDRLIAAAAEEPDNARRFELLSAAERILCEEELPIIPLFFRSGNYLLSPRFSGMEDNLRDLLPLQRVRFSGRK